MTRLVRAALLLGAVLALVGGTTGCGSDAKSSNDYVASLNKVQTDFAASVSKSTKSGSGTGAKDVFAALGTNIDKLIIDLKAIKPPGKVKDLHNQLISEMGQFKTAVQKAGASLKSGDPAKIAAAQTGFATNASAIGGKIGTTIEGINKKLHGG